MQTTRYIFQFFTLIALLLTHNVTAAQSEVTGGEDKKQYYDVEIILFKNVSVPRGRELNLPTPSPSETETTLDLSNPDNTEINLQQGFSNLQQEDFLLQDIVQQIKVSSRYKLLLHTGWRQPGLDTKESIPVWIKGGKIFGRGYSSIDQQDPGTVLQQELLKTPLTTDDDSKTNNIKPDGALGQLYELEGQIIITLSRYLHTQANLVLRMPSTVDNLIQNSGITDNLEVDSNEGGTLLNYSLNEKRRMRSKKLHYLDNPQFGMLILITPYEKLQQETMVDSTLSPAKLPITEENKATTSTNTQ